MAARLPLIESFDPDRPIARTSDTTLDQGSWLGAVLELSDHLGSEPLIHVSENRVAFMTAFAAAGLNDATNLLPPDRQAATIGRFRERFPDARLVSDDPSVKPDLLLDLKHLMQRNERRRDVPSVNGDGPAAIAFTSGSTGQPRPHTKTWGGTRYTARATAERLLASELNGPTHIIATVPAQHMYGLETTVMLALLGRAVIGPGRPFFPADIGSALAAVPEPRVLITTPVHLNAIVRANIDLPPMEFILSATAPLTDDLAETAERRFHTPVKEIYGCTEGGSLATRQTANTHTWQLLPGFRLTESERIESAIFSEPLTLPDIIERVDDTSFALLGRNEDMINVGGKRGSIGAIVAELEGITGVIEAAALFDPASGRLQAVARLQNTTPRAVLHELSKHIDPVFLPRPLLAVDAIPRSATGKTSRADLAALLNEH